MTTDRRKRYRATKKGRKADCQMRIRQRGNPEFVLNDDDWERHWSLESCDLCGVPLPVGTDPNKHFDHNHESGLYRGTLCVNCNRDLGAYERLVSNPKLADYLEVHCEKDCVH